MSSRVRQGCVRLLYMRCHHGLIICSTVRYVAEQHLYDTGLNVMNTAGWVSLNCELLIILYAKHLFKLVLGSIQQPEASFGACDS